MYKPLLHITDYLVQGFKHIIVAEKMNKQINGQALNTVSIKLVKILGSLKLFFKIG